jgi:hypothetical protein
MGIWLWRTEGMMLAAVPRIRCSPLGLRSQRRLKVGSTGSAVWRGGRLGGAGYDGGAAV